MNEKIYITRDGERFEALGADLEQILKDRADALSLEAAQKAAAIQTVIDKAALLAKLGINADEAKLLLS
jgi:hypothetical protein